MAVTEAYPRCRGLSFVLLLVLCSSVSCCLIWLVFDPDREWYREAWLADLTASVLANQSAWLPTAIETGQWPKELFSPFLAWSDEHGAFVSNATHADLFRARWRAGSRQANTSALVDEKIRLFLDGMVKAGLPPVINRGSLLSFLREGRLYTDDVDFVTFRRFIDAQKHSDAFLAHCLAPELPWKEHIGTFNGPGYQTRFSVENMPFDLYFVEEDVNHYWFPLWKGRGDEAQLYRCIAPGPTGFAPALHEASGAHFFIPTTAVLEMQYSYGPSWETPYNSNNGTNWNWLNSVRDFASSCQMSRPVSRPLRVRWYSGALTEWDC